MLRLKAMVFASALVIAGFAVVIPVCFAARPVTVRTWNARAAGAYLDQRQTWWESWPKARRDRGTSCVSCHTAVPYALARPQLRVVLQESESSAAERKLIADVVTRVRAWDQVAPFYGDWSSAKREKALESRGTEAVLNALILASRDQRTGSVSAEAREAFAHMFALQKAEGEEAGAWEWLNFGMRPWESRSAVYFGAALAAIALGMEPQGYAQGPELQPNIERLRTYLATQLDQSLWNRMLLRDNPDLLNRAMLLWASANLPTLISSDERQSIVNELWKAQKPDGAWSLASIGHWRHVAGAASHSDGDGYATGLIAYALEQTGTPPTEPHLARALAWLSEHQDPTSGAWTAWSLNEKRDPRSNVGKFMSDAATAYAVLALTRADVSLRVARSSRGSTAAAAPRPALPAPLRR